jgi:hypothetical protein
VSDDHSFDPIQGILWGTPNVMDPFRGLGSRLARRRVGGSFSSLLGSFSKSLFFIIRMRLGFEGILPIFPRKLWRFMIGHMALIYLEFHIYI